MGPKYIQDSCAERPSQVNEDRVTLAVMLCSHNRQEKTLACLKALGQTVLPANVQLLTYLLDDGSTDGTSHSVRTQFPDVRVIAGTGSLFWNRGMHKVWTEAASIDADFYVWLNDDTELRPSALSELLLDYETVGQLSIICGTSVSPGDQAELTYGGYKREGQILKPNGRAQLCYWFNGNCVLIPRRVFQLVGNLDPFYRHSLGDFDYGIRARYAGVALYVGGCITGVCEAHANEPNWRNGVVPLRQRFLALYGPLGCNPIEFFRFELRRGGAMMALVHFFSIHLRTLAPGLWK